MKTTIQFALTLVIAASLLASCSENKSSHQGHSGAGHPGAEHSGATDSAVLADHASHEGHGMSASGKENTQMKLMMASMEKMKAVPMSGNADRDFAAMMLEHHQGAIDMARDVLKTGTDTTIRRMAGTILTDQQKEIEFLKAYLQKKPATEKPTAHGPASAALMKSMDAMGAMHSLPLRAQPDADFVTLMMLHHRGAVSMAEAELAHGSDPGLRQLASSIIREQQKEIKAFQDWQTAHP